MLIKFIKRCKVEYVMQIFAARMFLKNHPYNLFNKENNCTKIIVRKDRERSIVVKEFLLHALT